MPQFASRPVFIRVQIVAGGFRGFGADENGKNREKYRPYNYNGFVRGSRSHANPSNFVKSVF
jgi:hypothetical protein